MNPREQFKQQLIKLKQASKDYPELKTASKNAEIVLDRLGMEVHLVPHSVVKTELGTLSQLPSLGKSQVALFAQPTLAESKKAQTASALPPIPPYSKSIASVSTVPSTELPRPRRYSSPGSLRR